MPVEPDSLEHRFEGPISQYHDFMDHNAVGIRSRPIYALPVDFPPITFQGRTRAGSCTLLCFVVTGGILAEGADFSGFLIQGHENGISRPKGPLVGNQPGEEQFVAAVHKVSGRKLACLHIAVGIARLHIRKIPGHNGGSGGSCGFLWGGLCGPPGGFCGFKKVFRVCGGAGRAG